MDIYNRHGNILKTYYGNLKKDGVSQVHDKAVNEPKDKYRISVYFNRDFYLLHLILKLQMWAQVIRHPWLRTGACGIRAAGLVNLMPHSNFAIAKNLHPLVS
jgi:hypothetical protein